jgi:uncharacterized NAD-dependent epimerase/dehydratase family protein
MALRKPYLLFLGDAASTPLAKTAFGLRDWAGDDVIGQVRLPGCGVDLGVPDLGFDEGVARGARSLVIGVAPVGGAIPPAWVPVLEAAIRAGLDLVGGLHQRLADDPRLAAQARAHRVDIHDVRRPDRAYPFANGRRRTGRRLLTVGVDCAVGKKYAALAITRALGDRRVDATFRATGQTGIMIAGEGVPLDAVVCDFAAGAAEQLSPDNAPDHWDVIEGQGSLFHPAYAGVTLALLHGSQPDAFVLCLDPGRKALAHFEHYPVVSPEAAIVRYELEGALTNPEIRCAGLAVNTSQLTAAEAVACKSDLAERFELPVFDPLAEGASALAAALIATYHPDHRS